MSRHGHDPIPLGPFEPCRHRRTLGRRLPAAHLGEYSGQPYGRFIDLLCTQLPVQSLKGVERRNPAPAPASTEPDGLHWPKMGAVAQHILPGAHRSRTICSEI